MNLGLRAKLTGSIALFMVLLAGFLIIYFPWRQAGTSERALTARGHDTAFVLAAALTSDVETRNKDNVKQTVARFVESRGDSSDIRYIEVTLANGEVVDSWTKFGFPVTRMVRQPLTAENKFKTVTKDDLLHLSISVGQGGSLHLGMSRAAIDVAVWDSRRDAIVLGSSILLLGIAVALLLGGSLTKPILEVADELDNVSNELAAAARDQEASSAEEAAAVAETRRSMETLLDSAQKIADRSSEVLGNAERSTNGSQQIASRIGNLNLLSERIADILASIMQVADKTDLLALNASLEGTRAGEAGKGFALVGAEMRRLAENVIESVAGIRELMAEMRDLSQAAVSASQEGNSSSTATRHSAQEIAMLTQDQRKATEQVIASMDELGGILNLTLDGIQRTSASASKLTGLASLLSRVVSPSGSDSDSDNFHEDNTA